MAVKYNREELLWWWVAGGHTQASFTDDVYRYLTAAQGGPPGDGPAPPPRPVSTGTEKRSSPKPAPRPAPPSPSPRPSAPSFTSGGLGTPATIRAGKPPVEVKQWSPVLVDPTPRPQPTFTPLPAQLHGPFAGADVPFQADAITTEYGRNIHTVLAVGYRLRAPDLALLAMLCLGFGENGWRTLGCNSSDHCGVFQLSSSWQAKHAYTDVAYWAGYAYEQGFYSYGGIIPIARAHPNYAPGRITNMCQGAYANLDEGQTYYDGQLPAARQALATYGPGARSGKPYKGSVSPLPVYSNSNSGMTLVRHIQALDWAGNAENAFKYIRGGANESAHMSGVLKDAVTKIDYVQPL